MLGCARQIEMCQCVDAERWSEVETHRALTLSSLRDWSEVNLDLASWFILKLFVSFFWNTSAAQRVTTPHTHQPNCICVFVGVGGGGLFKKSLVQPDQCDLYCSVQNHVWEENTNWYCQSQTFSVLLDYTDHFLKKMLSLLLGLLLTANKEASKNWTRIQNKFKMCFFIYW